MDKEKGATDKELDPKTIGGKEQSLNRKNATCLYP